MSGTGNAGSSGETGRRRPLLDDDEWCKFPSMPRSSVTLRIKRLHDPEDDTDIQRLTPGERLALVWRLTVDAWIFMGEPIGESRLSRHVGRVVR